MFVVHLGDTGYGALSQVVTSYRTLGTAFAWWCYRGIRFQSPTIFGVQWRWLVPLQQMSQMWLLREGATQVCYKWFLSSRSCSLWGGCAHFNNCHSKSVKFYRFSWDYSATRNPVQFSHSKTLHSLEEEKYWSLACKHSVCCIETPQISFGSSLIFKVDFQLFHFFKLIISTNFYWFSIRSWWFSVTG